MVQEPKSCASANSTIPAYRTFGIISCFADMNNREIVAAGKENGCSLSGSSRFVCGSVCPFVGGGDVVPRAVGVGELFIFVHVKDRFGKNELPAVVVGEESGETQNVIGGDGDGVILRQAVEIAILEPVEGAGLGAGAHILDH